MRSVTNYYLVNLALADLGMATLNCIPSFVFMRDRYGVVHFNSYPSFLNLKTLDLWVHLLQHQLIHLLPDSERIHPAGPHSGEA